MIHGFFTGLLSAGMGLVLVNIRPEMRKLILTGLFYDLGVLIIWSINLSFQIRFVFLTSLLMLIINIIWRLGLFRSVVVTALGTLLLSLGESIFLPIFLNTIGMEIQQVMQQYMLILLMPLPQITLSGLAIIICLKFNIHIFNFREVTNNSTIPLSGKRLRLILGLVISMIILIILQAVCNVTVFAVHGYNSLPWDLVGYISNTVIILVCLLGALLVIQLLELTDKESQYIIQTSYVETIEELYTAIRGQRHDLINHLQVLYGFLQMGNLKEVQDYLETLIGHSVNANSLVDTGNPGLSALLYIKSGIAITNGIDFAISIEKQVDDMAIPAYELNRIVGNIINNAFDYVMKLDEDERVVKFRICEAESFYLFEISNYGYIDDEVKDRLFEKGFSTKEGEHSGLGLYIVRDLVRRCEGHIEVDNQGQQVVFSLHLPRKKMEELNNALSRGETGGVAG